MPLTPLSDISGFTPLSNTGLTPLSDPNTSLLENKMRGVAAASDTKKQSLAPSSTTIPYEDLTVTDGDTLKNKLTGEIFRMNSGDAFETRHKKLDQPRIDKDREAIASELGVPTSYIPNQAVFDRGNKAKDVFGDILKGAGNITFNRTGKIDAYGRTLTDVTAAGSDQSLLPQMNNPELAANYGSKFNEAKKKEDDLRNLARRIDETQYSVSDANRETLLGGLTNAAAGGAVMTSDAIYNMAKSPFEAGRTLAEYGITNKQRELHTALTAKQEAANKAGTVYTPTPEEQAILERPSEAFMRDTVKPILNGEKSITAKDLIAGLTNLDPFQLNVHDKLTRSEFVKNNITDRLTAMQEGNRRLYNSAGSDELHKDAKALYNDSIEPTFVEGIQKFKKGDEVGGVLQVADAIANAGVGIFRVGANNPQAVAEEVVKQIPNSIMASKALLATFFGMYTNTASEVTDNFIKEHGRHPEGAEVDNIQVNSALSAIADSYADKMIVSKPGVARAVGREGLTESGQSFLEQDAAKQGASKIDFSEVYANGVIGALAGGGTNVAASPEAAIVEAARGVGTAANIGIAGTVGVVKGVKALADRVPDANLNLGNMTMAGLNALVPDGAGVALGDGLKAAGSLAGDITVGGAKAVGSAVGQYLESGFPIASQAVKSAFSKGKDAVDTATQAVANARDAVASSTTTPTVDPIEQSAKTVDSVEALNTLLRPENIASARATPEGSKTLVTEASRHNAEILKEFLAISDEATAPTEENTARSKVLYAAFKNNKEKIDGIKSEGAEADTTEADLTTATTPVTENTLPDHPDALQAVDRVIRSMRQPNKLTLEQAESFQGKATLTPEQSSEESLSYHV
jgi:hypothetical protein